MGSHPSDKNNDVARMGHPVFLLRSHSNCQGGLDGVVNVVAVNEFMDAHALLANGVKERSGIAGEDFADGGVAEHGVKAADAGGEFFGRTASPGALDGFDRAHDAVDGVANGMGEVPIEEQEFENPVGGDVGGVDLAIGLERRAAAEKTNLLEVLVAGMFSFRRAEEIGLVDLE